MSSAGSEPTDNDSTTDGLHIPLLEESLAYEKEDPKPSWRWWIHL